ncbi:VOC family protein [Pseudactinotalea suaedae]|uniref:VOC family protein n=1 Tax=Pseudactinotalea suaedae TaxID=1524924 RepID=UPI001390B59F|nr:VOC family protein [Pseudactinotalea suaedae]
MHRSRIGVVLIDHPGESYEVAAEFWAAAHASPRPDKCPTAESPYEELRHLPGGVELALQRTGPGTPPRVHLDIETDDVEAELARVTALGATIVERRESHAILQDPGGLLFCVVPVQNPDAFEASATSWP